MKSLIAAAAILVTLGTSSPAAGPTYREAALQAAHWIRNSAVKTDTGTHWLADPTDKTSFDDSLYTGTPGVVLFFLEASRLTGDQSFLTDARGGADYLISIIGDQKENGLYTGVAGTGFVLIETFKATKDPKYREAGLRCAQVISERAKKVGKGVEWSDTTDIIAGGAGIGLFLLYAAAELSQPAFRELAVDAARRLLELGIPESTGLKWRMSPNFARLMPNFSHGTAGIAYFLATVFKATGQKQFLDGAISGANYLASIADTENNACLIFHNEPEGKNLYYLGWCHGPVGTARLFYRLYQVTGDKGWMEWVGKSARGLVQSGIPEKQTPGFWNNVSQCCGSAGVAEFFLNLYRITKDISYLEFSKRVTGNLLTRATRDREGMRWIQAEHRIKPDLLIAQTGYMQGAAGIGMLMLHIDASYGGRKPSIVFPDSPFE
jgi:lantibiotic modifying enzyme